ncbi:MAG: class I SAM-dependent rRNA methyltransferase [Streptococcus sp.]|nr:class I SAM-dependent rRNA methyltransferase [Streptococcus sp.]
MNKVTVSQKVEEKLTKGCFVLDKQDFSKLSLNNQCVELQNQAGKFIGTAYLSLQNKGIGWFISPRHLTLTVSFFRELFEKAKEKRSDYQDSKITTAYRLFNQDGDGFGGISIDIYNEFAVFSWYNTFVFQVKDLIVEAFQEVFPHIKGAYEKIRFKGMTYESAHVYGEEAPEFFTILENGVHYRVFLNDGLMTGIFLDQHDVRGSLVNGLARGKSVLNLFSYTAAFSVAAAVGGASQTTSVDLAKRSRELSKAHFVANDIDLAQHHFVVMDVFSYFKYAKRHQMQFDFLILDPPSFARNKKQTFSVAKDYNRLIEQALDILSPDGVMIISTNAANLSKIKLKKEIEKGFAGVPHSYLSEYRLPADFVYNKKDESSNYLKVFIVKVNK